MTRADQIGQDLDYVRAAVQKNQHDQRTPAPIAWIWAIYVLVGYALLDYNRTVGGICLAAAAPVGAVLSWLIARRLATQAGVRDHADSWRHAMHWGAAIALGVVAVAAMGMVNHVPMDVTGRYIAMVIGVIYFLAGVHFDRNFIWLGLLLTAGSIAIGFMPAYGWTTLGVLVALGLVIPTFFPSRRATVQQ